MFIVTVIALQIENLQEQLRDKEKQMSSLKERVKSLQADTSNTDTALTTLEESLAEKVSYCLFVHLYQHVCQSVMLQRQDMCDHRLPFPLGANH